MREYVEVADENKDECHTTIMEMTVREYVEVANENRDECRTTIWYCKRCEFKQPVEDWGRL